MIELVSIMMPAYNAENYIQSAIESVLAQTYSHWELIIVNDGSTDNTQMLAEAYNDSRIRVIHQENSGEAVARNTALANMAGKWVAFLDADDLYHADHLAETVNYLVSHPEYDAVYTDGFHIDPQGNQLQSLSSRRRGPFEGRIYEEIVRASDVFGPPLCTVLRRSIITEHKLKYDRRIVIGPDWDFFTQYTDLAQFGYLDKATCYYRVHETNITIQVGLQKRAGYLAICRENAIKMESFNQCSSDTRVAVFYDLLVNLLPGLPDKQTEVTEWEEFKLLPIHERARLLRLIASKAILTGNTQPEIKNWLCKAQELNPSDKPSKWLLLLFEFNTTLCQNLLQIKEKLTQPKKDQNSPLGDIKHKK